MVHDTRYFVDSISMEFILIPCLLILLCTGYWRSFLKAFVYLIKRDCCTAEMIKDSANAIKLVCRSSLIWGSIGFTISTVNLMRRHMLDPEFAAFCGDISVALLPLFYSLGINGVLMPLYFELNRLHTKNAEWEYMVTFMIRQDKKVPTDESIIRRRFLFVLVFMKRQLR